MHILFVTSNRLGDAVLSTGVLGSLAERYPDSDITVVCGPIPAPLLHSAPNVARVITMPKRRMGLHWFKTWSALFGTYFGLVVDMRESAIGYLLGAWRVKRTKMDLEGQHAVEEAASILKLTPTPSPRLWIEGVAKRSIDRRFEPGTQILAIGPTANFEGKQWPIGSFAAAARALTGPGGAMEGATTVVLGAAHERTQALPMINDETLACEDLVGQLSLPEIAALLERADLYLGNDSGLMHMAAAVGCPTIGVFGPSDPLRYGPYGPKCRALAPERDWISLWKDFYEAGKSAEEVMGGVTADAVVESASALLRDCRKVAPS